MRSYLAGLLIVLPLGVVSLGSGYGALAAPLDDGTYPPPSAQGQLFLQLQQLQDEVAALRGTLEEQQNEIQRLQQDSLDRYQELDRRLNTNSGAGLSKQGTAPSTDTSGSATGKATNPQPADPDKEKLYYDAAYDLIRQKDFQRASQAFAAFLNRYPQSQYAGNAQYWLGEVSLAKGDLNAAEQAFTKVGQNYPNHGKVPDSLYKLAGVERRLGNQEKADGLLQQVVSQYPDSSAAKLAQNELQRSN